jgi:glycosyltransferase involved in cell wall biosynthesis
MDERTLIIVDNDVDINFYLIGITFYNFTKNNTCVINNYPDKNITKLTNVLTNIVSENDNDGYTVVICNYAYYVQQKNETCKFIVYYDDELLNNFVVNDNVIFIKECDIKWHLNEVTLYNTDLGSYCKLVNEILYTYEFPKLKECFYISNSYLSAIGINPTIVGHINENIMLEELETDYFCDYGICKLNNEFYSKLNNTYSKININKLKDDLAGTVKTIKYHIVDHIEQKNMIARDHVLHFTIAILSYNNEKYVKKNLKSALEQNYTNFDVLFINCNSTDKTQSIAESFDNKNLTIIKETSRVYQTENFVISTLLAKKDSIIVSLDGDDWFPHNNVLSILNKVYLSQRCLLTYGSYMEFPFRNIRVWKEKSLDELQNIRKYKKSLSHLRTWNKNLFLNINLDDLKINNKFPEMAGDVSVLLYMAEMCPDKCVFINEPMYVYNRTNCNSDSITNESLQISTAEIFFKKKSYSNKNYNKHLSYDNNLLYLIENTNHGLLKVHLIDKYLDCSKVRLEYIKSNKLTNSCMEHESSDNMVNIQNIKNWLVFFNDERINSIKRKHNPYTAKLVIAIISCKARLHKAIEKKKIFDKYKIANDYDCKIFIGDTSISDTFCDDNNIVYLKVPDNYESLVPKVYEALKWIKSNTDFKYVFKTDDDIQINFDKLYSLFLREVNNKVAYAGNVSMFSPFVDSWHFGKCQDPDLNKTKININVNGIYCSGGGYFINITNEKIIDDYLNNYKLSKIIAEDLLMGITMNNNNIIPIHLEYFKENIIKNWEGETSENVIYHYFSRSLLKTK